MIEPAQIQDCADIIYVIQKSILSCVLDHQNNTQIIADWLANKTVEQLSSWMQHNPSYVYRDQQQHIIAFILFSKQGDILLNYVLPEGQHQGIGSQLIAQVRYHLQQLSITQICVESTLTAAPFYQKQGFIHVANLYDNHEIYAYKMVQFIY